MSIRKEKKAQTRSALLNAALQLVKEGGNFATISIREIAKQAGIVPTAFYRHFKDTNELGLNLVDELSACLRQLVRSTREESTSNSKIINNTVHVLDEYIQNHRELFMFMTQGRTGGTPEIRKAIRNELNVFSLEIVSDLAQQQSFPAMNSAQLKMVTDLLVSTITYSTTDLLDLQENTVLKTERLTLLKQQFRVIALGAAEWRTQ
ncbi:MAG: TetR family transcriptional regulator [Moraxellaceae bacterium]|nr:MAG: TetR family transcriptional regulator [Moraxellaceae bacterium]